MKSKALLPIILVSMATLPSCAPTATTADSGSPADSRASSRRLPIPAFLRPDLSGLSLASLLPGSKIKVVEARENDLKEMPTGQELAKAHRSHGTPSFWAIPETLYFEQPEFSQPGDDLDAGLLPPKTTDQ